MFRYYATEYIYFGEIKIWISFWDAILLVSVNEHTKSELPSFIDSKI